MGDSTPAHAIVVCARQMAECISPFTGVTSLLCLMTREKDDDTPVLSLLLCESLVAVYLCLLTYGLVTCHPSLLYR